MRNIWIICRRELAAYFTSPVAYVFIVIFLALAGGLTFFFGSWLERGQERPGVLRATCDERTGFAVVSVSRSPGIVEERDESPVHEVDHRLVGEGTCPQRFGAGSPKPVGCALRARSINPERDALDDDDALRLRCRFTGLGELAGYVPCDCTAAAVR